MEPVPGTETIFTRNPKLRRATTLVIMEGLLRQLLCWRTRRRLLLPFCRTRRRLLLHRQWLSPSMH